MSAPVFDADTTVGGLLFKLSCDVADLMERVALLECYAGWPSDALRDELRDSVEDRGVTPVAKP